MTVTKDVIAKALQISPARIKEFHQSKNVIRVFLTDSQEVLNLNVDKCKPFIEQEQTVKPNTKKKTWGVVLVIFGALVTVSAFHMDTTVSTKYGSVHNIGLMQKQNNNIQLGGIIFVAGIILCCLGEKRSS
ncbi:MAG: hypothetical protein KME18_02745 [Phormidium tanganyikae FI6-MK23]|jgi:hypothetical protein|nr:hypothetical protein [Phormidium tanganyikae FI6-MK23]